jgi:hypothetical protein
MCHYFSRQFVLMVLLAQKTRPEHSLRKNFNFPELSNFGSRPAEPGVYLNEITEPLANGDGRWAENQVQRFRVHSLPRKVLIRGFNGLKKIGYGLRAMGEKKL